MLASTEMVWLLAASAKGDQEAFERLYLGTRARLYGMCLRILRRSPLAEEVMQEAYAEIWRRAGEFNPRLGSPVTWMVGITRSQVFDLLRKSGHASSAQASIEDEPRAIELPAAVPEQSEPASMSEGLRSLLACLGTLEEEQRRTLLLAYYNGWSREQLAAKFDRPADAIADRLRTSVLALRECLQR
jgi:RNA polymerase sigma-70 factor, ECF subfamily